MSLKGQPNLFSIDDALNFTLEQAKELTLKHQNTERVRSCEEIGAATFYPKAEGSHLTDCEGNVHLDMITGLGVVGAGHNNPTVISAIKKCMDNKQFIMAPLAYHNISAAFAANMARLSPGGQLTKVLLATGGAEAIEGALKLVKIACRRKTNKNKIVACYGGFHGKTSGAVALTDPKKWSKWQQPLLPNVVHVPYGDAAALGAVCKDGSVMGFFAETIQGEGGIVTPPDDYFSKVRQICDKYDVIMVNDEIQCGFARTGKMWCIEHYDVIPDVLTFAKGVSGGLIPSGGYMAKEALYNQAYGDHDTCFHHTATYQDNAMSAAAGLGVLEYIFENNIIEKCAKNGEYLRNRFLEIKARYPGVIKDIRGKGLMIGIACNKIAGSDDYYTPGIVIELMKVHKVQVMFTINNETVFRCLPTWDVSKEDMDWACNALEISVKNAYNSTRK